MTHGRTKPTIDTHSMHTAPPAPRHPHHDSDTMQNPLNEKYRHTEPAPWSARHHPFGEGRGHTGTVLGQVQGSEHGLQFLANKELQMQIQHPTRESEVRPRHQAQTPQKKADTQNRPMRTTHLTPRYHPIIKQADEGARLDYFNAHNTTCTTLGLAQGAEHKCLPEQVIRDSHSPPRRAQALRPDPPSDSGTGRYEVSATRRLWEP